MPIEAPSNTLIGSGMHPEFVLCKDFAFRPSTVNGCSHQPYAHGTAVTTMEDFVRGWLITRRTSSGKTQCAINRITYQVSQNVPHWGSVCLDQKGLYWEILVKMATHFGYEENLTLLQTRPLGKNALWQPVHTINITGNPNVPASTYAKVIVDTALLLTGGRGQNPFFPTKAQIAIQTGFEILRQMNAYVTIPNIHCLLLHKKEGKP